jgi:hypothetical protein
MSNEPEVKDQVRQQPPMVQHLLDFIDWRIKSIPEGYSPEEKLAALAALVDVWQWIIVHFQVGPNDRWNGLDTDQ